MGITFKNPIYLWFLLALFLLIFLHFVTLRRTKRKALKFANFEAIERVSGSEVLSKNILLLYIRLLIIICVILAIAGTTIWYTGKLTSSDFVLAIDASASMATQDIKPSRLEAAKEAAIAFVDALKAKTKIGVLSFSGASFVEQELTSDMIKVKNAIKNIELKYVGGTDILDAVVTSTDMLFRGENLKTIILITDGQINVGSVEDIIAYATKNGVAIHTIGIGTPAGGEMSLAPGSSTQLLSKLDEESLQSIAYNTGGIYFRATTKEELYRAYNRILTSGTVRLSFDASPTLIMIALLLLLVEWFLINTRYRTLP
jgi:Ca-activated chloride channel family protein